jgi:signal transduction histidine kinase
MGFLEMLSRERLSERQREFVQTASDSGKWLKVLATGILDVAKMEAGQVTLDRQPLVLDNEIQQALKLVSYKVHEKDLRMEVTVDPELPMVPADAEFFRRIVVNLIGNAAKFTPKGSTIRLRASCDDARNAVVVSVQDEGPGIAREHQGRIFDKFYQVAVRKGGQLISVGLGLTFCRMAVAAHGGRIWVESEPGHGARFSFCLPVHPAE